MAKIAIDGRIIFTTTGRYIERLIHYLAKIDDKNQYVILLSPDDIDKWQAPNGRFSKVVAPYAQFSLGEQIGFARLLGDIKPDLVHFTVPHRPVAFFKKNVTTMHDLTLLNFVPSDKNQLVFRFKQLVGRFAFWSIAHSSSAIITPTNYVKNAYTKFAGISPDKVKVTYEGADLGKFKAEPYPELKNKNYIMYVGNQSNYKNIRRLIEAHQLLLQKQPDLLLVCVGKISGKNGVTLARNKAWAEEKGFKNVIYTDFVSDEQLTWLYQNVSAYVFPSLSEGFGLPGLEAMSCGAPVVSSNATCLPEVYGEAAHYFDPTNTLDIAAKINEVLTDEKLRQSLIKAGYEQVKKYSWEKMAKETLSVYEKALRS